MSSGRDESGRGSRDAGRGQTNRRPATHDPRPLFAEGVRHFNNREFWEAHESWEAIWLEADADVEQFLQGLIQLTAAYHHFQRGTFRGGVRLVDAALRRLSGYPQHFWNLDRAGAEEAARRHAEWARTLLASGEETARIPEDEYPKMSLSG